jgi:RNA methyltransferase, TrmH family
VTDHPTQGESRFTHVSSSANPLIKSLRRLSQASTAYRRQGEVWLEGDHLCSAALARGIQPELAVFCESFWPQAQSGWAQAAIKNIVIPDGLMREISALESPASMGFLIRLPLEVPMQPHAPSIILDRLQDAGNVGSILRSAAAFGFGQVIAVKGTAALWSPKVLRAGMGAHFGLALHEGIEVDALAALTVPIAVTSSHQGRLLHETDLPMPCAWVFGHEGQGASESLVARASLHVRIAQPGGEESLNVAAAAAICLYASSLVCHSA